MFRSRAARRISWLLQLVAAGILLQTLYFKFTAAPESVWIFSTLGLEPWGRIGTGAVELVAALLLLLPATVTAGALLACGLMAGALASHLMYLGIAVQGDGGVLFGLAVAVLGCSLGVLFLRRSEIPLIGWRFRHA